VVKFSVHSIRKRTGRVPVVGDALLLKGLIFGAGGLFSENQKSGKRRRKRRKRRERKREREGKEERKKEGR
jgi:protein involved in polysaccharide export with SLBB domain